MGGQALHQGIPAPPAWGELPESGGWHAMGHGAPAPAYWESPPCPQQFGEVGKPRGATVAAARYVQQQWEGPALEVDRSAQYVPTHSAFAHGAPPQLSWVDLSRNRAARPRRRPFARVMLALTAACLLCAVIGAGLAAYGPSDWDETVALLGD